MEKGPSTFAEYWTSPYNEIDHFYGHGYEMGYLYLKDYSEAAVDFANADEENILSFTSEDGTIYKYCEDTNEFMMINRNGKIITYFEPEDEIDYFLSLFEKFGAYWN